MHNNLVFLFQVLMGPDDINEAFITALRAQEEDHIIDKLEQTHVTEEEIECTVTFVNPFPNDKF